MNVTFSKEAKWSGDDQNQEFQDSVLVSTGLSSQYHISLHVTLDHIPKGVQSYTGPKNLPDMMVETWKKMNEMLQRHFSDNVIIESGTDCGDGNLNIDSLPFVFEPIMYPSTQVRLLQFEKVDLTGPSIYNVSSLHFSMETFNLTDAPPYAAFSYSWASIAGDLHGTTPLPPMQGQQSILINGRRFEVSETCYYALGQVAKSQVEHKLFWIDSICIDQQNLDEKAAQVGIMGEIYEKADLVLACVGPDAKNSAFVFRVLRRVAATWRSRESEPPSRKEFKRLLVDFLRQEWAAADFDDAPWDAEFYIKGEGARKGQDALYKRDKALYTARLQFIIGIEHLGDRRYWNRTWILQELWLGKQVLILCGDESILPLDDFFLAMSIIRETNNIRRAPAPLLTGSPMRQLLKNLPSLRQMIKGSRGPAKIPICDAITAFSHTGCTDYRDRIYGLLRISSWGSTTPEPDYRVSRDAFIFQFMQHASSLGTYPANFTRALGVLLQNSGLGLDDLPLIREGTAVTQFSVAQRQQIRLHYPCSAHYIGAKQELPLKGGRGVWRRSFRDSRCFQPYVCVKESQLVYFPSLSNSEVCGHMFGDVQNGDYVIQISHSHHLAMVCRPSNTNTRMLICGYALLFDFTFLDLVLPQTDLDVYIYSPNLLADLVLERAFRTEAGILDREHAIELCEMHIQDLEPHTYAIPVGLRGSSQSSGSDNSVRVEPYAMPMMTGIQRTSERLEHHYAALASSEARCADEDGASSSRQTEDNYRLHQPDDNIWETNRRWLPQFYERSENPISSEYDSSSENEDEDLWPEEEEGGFWERPAEIPSPGIPEELRREGMQ